MLLLLIAGPGGLVLWAAFSPMGPLIRYCMFGLFALAVAAFITAHLPGGLMHH